MLLLRKTILEMIARGGPLESTMDRLCREVEGRLPGVRCSVAAQFELGLLRPVAAPRIARATQVQMECVPVGPDAGPCGAAAYFGHTVALIDLAADPRFADLRDLDGTALAACRASPIIGGTGQILGVLTLYFDRPRDADPSEVAVAQSCLDLCAIALERHALAAEREYRATHDELTGLANRSALNATLARLGCESPGAWGLIALDLDNLKPVNDTYGHHVGDCLLKVAASRLAAAAAPDLVYRIGGDEFLILLQAPGHIADIEATAMRLLAKLAEPADCGGFRMAPEASMGGAMVAIGDRLPEAVRQHADHALYCAKETRRGGFVRYWPGLGSPITDRIRHMREIEAALREDRIQTVYQPIVALATGRLVGVEALCRIVMPGGAIRPAADFNLADSDAQIAYELTRTILRRVTGDMARWRETGCDPGFAAINLSSADLRAPGLVDEVATILGEQAIETGRLVLDLNETTHLGLKDDIALSAIADLRATGVRIALDDFGSGLASLSHLVSVPVDMIKLGPALTIGIGADAKATAIIAGMIDISRRLGIDVIAESIESQRQFAALAQLGCAYGQGYHVSRPLAADDVAGWRGDAEEFARLSA